MHNCTQVDVIFLKAIGPFRFRKKIKVHRFTNNLQGLQKAMVKDFSWNIIPWDALLFEKTAKQYKFSLTRITDLYETHVMTRRNARKQGWVFPLFSPNSDDRLSLNFHRFVIWYRSCGTQSVGLGQHCLPKGSNGFNLNLWTLCFMSYKKYPYPLTRDVSTLHVQKKSKTGIQTFGGVHIKPGWLVQLVSCRHIFLLLRISCKSSRDYHFSTTWLIIPPRLHVHENKPLGIHITCTVLLYVYSNQSILLVLHTYRKVDQRAWLFNLEKITAFFVYHFV